MFKKFQISACSSHQYYCKWKQMPSTDLMNANHASIVYHSSTLKCHYQSNKIVATVQLQAIFILKQQLTARCVAK